MAKGPLIKQDIREKITDIYLEHPEWRAKEIQKEVTDRLHRENPRVDPNWPGLSAVQKELTRIRASHLKLSDSYQDKVWSLLSYYDFEIPPDALPTVLRVWLMARKEDRISITNREVKWVVRLYKVIKDDRMLKDRAKSLASSELKGEILNLGLIAHPGLPLALIEDMTGKKFNAEESANIRVVELLTGLPNHMRESILHEAEEFEALLQRAKKEVAPPHAAKEEVSIYHYTRLDQIESLKKGGQG